MLARASTVAGVVDHTALLDDLRAETALLDAVLSSAIDWSSPTPAAGWTVHDQVSHLAAFDDASILAVLDPEVFVEQASDVGDPDVHTAAVAERYRGLPDDELLDWFRSARAELLGVLGDVDPRARVPWYTTEMSAATLVTSRIMETWAHGQDVYDAVGAEHLGGRALRHVADLGVRTMAHSFVVNGLEAPAEPVLVDLVGPLEERWTWGPSGAPATVRGTAVDFAGVVTRRRHVSATRLAAAGTVAERWLEIAQAYGGPPGSGRPAR